MVRKLPSDRDSGSLQDSTSLWTSFRRSESCAADCPVCENYCFLYFTQFLADHSRREVWFLFVKSEVEISFQRSSVSSALLVIKSHRNKLDPPLSTALGPTISHYILHLVFCMFFLLDILDYGALILLHCFSRCLLFKCPRKSLDLFSLD